MRYLPALAITASIVLAGDGQGPADMSARVEGVRLGTYWFGAKLRHDDFVGKVVLVEVWGS